MEKNTKKLGKGIAKIRSNEKVFKTREQQEKRKVTVDSRTWVYISSDDNRSDDQVVRDFINRTGYERV